MNAPQFFTWQHAIISSESLQPTTRHICLTIGCHMDMDGSGCFPSYGTLARECGLDRSTIIRHVTLAASAGYLHKESRKRENQSFTSNLYTIRVPAAGQLGTSKTLEQPEDMVGGGTVPLPPTQSHSATTLVAQDNHPSGTTPPPQSHSATPITTHLTTQRTPQVNISLPTLAQDASDGFDAFWQAYPSDKRHNKAKCLQYWKRDRLAGKCEQVVQAVELWKQSKQWRERDGRFICWPQKFLNERRYEGGEIEAMMRATMRTADAATMMDAIIQEQATLEGFGHGNH